MSPIRLFLVRHGNTFEAGQTPVQVGAATDLPLTAQGKIQAQRMADYLLAENISPAAIYCGNLQRQTETAQILGKNHLLEPALTEIDYGLWEGLTSEAITARWPQEYEKWTAQSAWPAHVFKDSFQNRLNALKQWLNVLRKTYAPGEAIVGVTSNGIIRLFYSFQQEAWNLLLKERQMEKLKVKTGHFCELLLFPDSIEIKSWNTNPSLIPSV